jgi:hypothetical protein
VSCIGVEGLLKSLEERDCGAEEAEASSKDRVQTREVSVVSSRVEICL